MNDQRLAYRGLGRVQVKEEKSARQVSALPVNVRIAIAPLAASVRSTLSVGEHPGAKHLARWSEHSRASVPSTLSVSSEHVAAKRPALFSVSATHGAASSAQ